MIANRINLTAGEPSAKIMRLHSKHKKDTATLISACLQNDRLAQSELYKKWYNKLLSICLRYANDKDEAKQLVNESFYKILKNLNKLQSAEVFGSWSKKIAINTCLDHLRSKNKIEIVDHELLPEPTIDNKIIDTLSAEDILAALQKVSPIARTVFSMHVIDGYKHREIAEKLQFTESTSRWYLSNAKGELKELLKNIKF